MQPVQGELNFEEAARLRDAGMQQAVDHAEQVHEGWSDVALNFLKNFAAKAERFMTEDVRKAAEGIVPEPPTARAWGAVVVKAKKAGFIKHVGFNQVKNKKAHCTPASVWCATS